MQPLLKGVPDVPPAPRPDGLLADNGEYYFSEFPPGQAVASLDLSSGDPLTDFLNNNRAADGIDNSVRQPPQPDAARPPLDPPQTPAAQPIAVPRVDSGTMAIARAAPIQHLDRLTADPR